MTNDAELAPLDPFDILDEEAVRIEAKAADLTDDDWARPSRCEGWSVRDVLAHLLTGERYHQACLDGEVAGFLQSLGERGATDLHAANALLLEDLAGRPPADLLAEWSRTDADTRRRFRERGDENVDTSVGPYPNRWQAFHVASELATHGDDMLLPESPEEHQQRGRWRAPFSRFALAEVKPDVVISVEGGRTVVDDGNTRIEVDDDDLVEGVAGRLPSSSPLAADARALLSTMP